MRPQTELSISWILNMPRNKKAILFEVILIVIYSVLFIFGRLCRKDQCAVYIFTVHNTWSTYPPSNTTDNRLTEIVVACYKLTHSHHHNSRYSYPVFTLSRRSCALEMYYLYILLISFHSIDTSDSREQNSVGLVSSVWDRIHASVVTLIIFRKWQYSLLSDSRETWC